MLEVHSLVVNKKPITICWIRNGRTEKIMYSIVLQTIFTTMKLKSIKSITLLANKTYFNLRILILISA